MVYDIHYDLCAVVINILTILTFFKKKDISRKQNIEFILVVIIVLLSSICDIVSGLLISSITPETKTLASIFSYGYLILHNLLPGQFAVYLLTVTGVNKLHAKRFYFIFFLPILIVLILLFTNPFTNAIFYFDKDLIYKHGKGMYILYASSAYYVVTILYYIIRYNKSIPSNMATALTGFILASASAVAFQFFFPSILIELFIQSLLLLVTLFTIENDEEVINPITKIYNRKSFFHENDTSIKANLRYSIIIIKITNFKYYLDTVGFHTMDDILYNVAQWLRQAGGKTSVYDCDNGTFTILRYGKNQNDLDGLCVTILERFEKEWQAKNINISLDAQISAVRIPSDINNIQDLRLLIDARYTHDGKRTNFIQYNSLHILKRHAKVEGAIKKALENNSFQVFFQPIWDCKKNKICSAEALLRLFDDELGFIPPNEFIPIAENNGSIIQIGDFVFNKACELYQKEHMKDFGIELIDVNISPVQCMNHNLAKRFEKILEKNALSAKCINLEITENAAINSLETFMHTLQELRNMRFNFSLDDYGTGYSNAAYIFNMDFNIIKLDKSILWEADAKANAKIILKNYINMIKEMQLKIVVEGVETEGHKNLVTNLGCDYCQGFFFSKPLPVSEFIEYCKKFNQISPVNGS